MRQSVMRRPVALGGLALTLVLGACGTPSDPGFGQTTPHGAVTGQVIISPACPVQRPGRACRPKPVAGAAVTVIGSGIRERARADATGHFSMALPAGHYTVRATNAGGYHSTSSAQVEVRSTPVTVTLAIDSGIR